MRFLRGHGRRGRRQWRIPDPNSGAQWRTNSGRFDLLRRVTKPTTAGKVREWKVCLRGSSGEEVSGRLCVIRKSEQAIRRAQRRLRRKESKKQTKLKPETFEFARYVMVFTTYEQGTAAQVLQWYRMRWQIELVFKRLKSLLRLGHLPKYDARSSRAWLSGKLLIALLTQKLIRIGRYFPLGLRSAGVRRPAPGVNSFSPFTKSSEP